MPIDGSWELRSSWSLQKKRDLSIATLRPHSRDTDVYGRPMSTKLSSTWFNTLPVSSELESLWFPFSNSFPLSYFLLMVYSSCQLFHPFFFPHRCGMGFPSAWVLLSREILVTRITLWSALIHHKKLYTYYVKSTFIQGSKKLNVWRRENARVRRWGVLWTAVIWT